MTHDLTFYIIVIVSILAFVATYFLINTDGAFDNHIYIGEGDSRIYLEYEKEDPSIVVKNGSMGQTYSPVQPIFEQNSIDNSFGINNLVVTAMIYIFLAHTVYQASFFGRLYKNGVIRNYIIAGISKVKVFASCFILSELLLILQFALGIAVTALTCAIKGGYMIIWWPSFALCLLAIFLILSFVSVCVLALMFLSRNQLITLILPVVLGLAAVYYFTPEMIRIAGNQPYEADIEVGSRAYTLLTDEKNEYYVDSDSFAEKLYVNGELIDYLDKSKPNPDYPGDLVRDSARFFIKSNVMSFPEYLLMFEYDAFVRDGVMTQYIVISSCYTVAMFAVGCIIARKRNLN